ncbi:hypothetical protein I4F81_003399 [Pyropia yezoensis]|uniref:Uncharacterized protein n=1 Tax=Pyropia yezoensis TaxID=2788 RepID=A0ACC3BSH3_PYRYE|nr:hypothetical protein I4F81_003399 [Neopyropia yezoensis]
MPRIVGAAVAAAAVAAGTVPTATTATMITAAATVAASLPPLATSREAPALLPPAVRALNVQTIGNVTYQLVVQVNGSTCPSTFSMGAGAPVTGVPPTTARLYDGNNIRQGSGACVGDGLLAVPVETLLNEATMASLGEPGVAATLTSTAWSKVNVGWATAVGLRADSWRCNGFDPWPATVVAYFSDARRDIRTSLQEAKTVLRAGQRHLLFANAVSMYCIMSAPAPDEVIEPLTPPPMPKELRSVS